MNTPLGEGRLDPVDRLSSLETAKVIIRTFDYIKDTLIQIGVRCQSRRGKTRYYVSHPALWNIKDDSPEYKELVSKNFTSGIDMRYGDIGVSSAEVVRRLPGSKSRSDDWHARFMFPRPHAEGPSNGRRVVLDFWQIDYSTLDEASRKLSRDESGKFYADFFKKQSNGIPAGAVGIQHFVFGRDEKITEGQRQMVEDILGLFLEACPPVEEVA